MKLSGHLKLEIVDELTGEIIKTIEQDNIITDLAYSNTNMTNNCYWNGRTIFISTETATPVRSKTSIQVSGFAYRGAGQIIMYRNGLILCSSADVGKTLTGFFSYVARSD